MYVLMSAGFCGFFGLIAVGIFGTDNNAALAGYAGSAAGHRPFSSGEQFGVQAVGAFTILAWVMSTSFVMFTVLKYTIGLRLTSEEEDMGNDALHYNSEHPVTDDQVGTKGTRCENPSAQLSQVAPADSTE